MGMRLERSGLAPEVMAGKRGILIMEYLIVIVTASMIAVYALLIGRALPKE
jgi:hypothetical protein